MNCYEAPILGGTIAEIILLGIFGIFVIGFFGVFFYGILRDSDCRF